MLQRSSTTVLGSTYRTTACAPADWQLGAAAVSELRRIWAQWRTQLPDSSFGSRLRCVVGCGKLATAVYNGFIAVLPLNADAAELETAVHRLRSSAAYRLSTEMRMRVEDGESTTDLEVMAEHERTLHLALLDLGDGGGLTDGAAVLDLHIASARSATVQFPPIELAAGTQMPGQ